MMTSVRQIIIWTLHGKFIKSKYVLASDLYEACRIAIEPYMPIWHTRPNDFFWEELPAVLESCNLRIEMIQRDGDARRKRYIVRPVDWQR